MPARGPSLRGTAKQREEALSSHGIPHDVKEYEGVGHGFMNQHAQISWVFRVLGWTVNTRYDAEATADTRRRVRAFFAEHLR